MAINLNKYRECMQQAWREVLDDKCDTNWALYGYEGQSNDLNLISKGSGGLEEMAEDLSTGSVMYAFCQVHDPKTSLPKYVLIIWQGEGAPIVRKGMCANHLPDVESFFKGAHITISARAEEDVDPNVVTEKVSKSTGSAYSFKQRAETTSEKKSEPVGTTYKRVDPVQEINYKERDKFWEKEEQEEKRRQLDERQRREEEKKKQEQLLREREAAEAAERERRAALREQKTRESQAAAPPKPIKVDSDELAEREKEELERRGRSEALRRERSLEARSLIAKRTVNARAVFEQNTSAGQLNLPRGRRASYQPSTGQINGGVPENGVGVPSEPERVPSQALGRKASLPAWPPAEQGDQSSSVAAPISNVTAPISSVASPTSSVAAPISRVVNAASSGAGDAEPSSLAVNDSAAAQGEDTQSEEEQDWESEPSSTGTIVRKTHKSSSDAKSSSNSVEGEAETFETLQGAEQETPIEPSQPSQSNGAYAAEEDDEDLGLRARALYDYQAADNTEITFDPGDIITHIDQIDQGWWQGLAPDGSFGLFPANYVQLID